MIKMKSSLIVLVLCCFAVTACVCDDLLIKKEYYDATTGAMEGLLPGNLNLAKNAYNDLKNNRANVVKMTGGYATGLRENDDAKRRLIDANDRLAQTADKVISDITACNQNIANRQPDSLPASIASLRTDLGTIKELLKTIRSDLDSSKPADDKSDTQRKDIIALIDSFESTINEQLLDTLPQIDRYVAELRQKNKYDAEIQKNNCK